MVLEKRQTIRYNVMIYCDIFVSGDIFLIIQENTVDGFIFLGTNFMDSTRMTYLLSSKFLVIENGYLKNTGICV